jgi:hypothetical protein
MQDKIIVQEQLTSHFDGAKFMYIATANRNQITHEIKSRIKYRNYYYYYYYYYYSQGIGVVQWYSAGLEPG